VESVVLGRTGLEVGVAGLGCGGHSRLGQATGSTSEESIAIVQRALDLGITLIDTARVYGTEEIVGKALAHRRSEVVISTKVPPIDQDGPRGAAGLRTSLEKSLEDLRTDTVDVYHLHGVQPETYDHCVDVLVPEMFKLRDEGKIRFLAISEGFGRDSGHAMLERAVTDDCWDVMMVGFNLLNPSARDRVFPATQPKGIGILVMFAVRRLLSQGDELRRVVGELVAEGRIDSEGVSLDDPLGFLVTSGEASSVVDAAYRFARHEPGTDVILTGTGNPAHLEANVASLAKGPLPAEDLARLTQLFGHLDHLSGN
jgi:aryl-alcohol dehydrogenase-like predicted oxidoreductase